MIVACALAAAFAACAPAKPVDPKFAEVARIHKANCGKCHGRVEPGDKTRAELEAALAKHRSRVRMSESDWALLVDYLAADAAPAAK